MFVGTLFLLLSLSIVAASFCGALRVRSLNIQKNYERFYTQGAQESLLNSAENISVLFTVEAFGEID